MKKSYVYKSFIFGFLSLIAFFAFAKQEKVIQIFRNGEVIQEYSVSEIDYIEVNDLIPAPEEVNVSVANNQITIKWNPVEGATYNIYRSSDNVNFTLLASNIKETSYTDTKPFHGSNYYKVKAVVDNVESDYTTSVNGTISTVALESGIYLGIYGFSRGFQTQPIQYLSDENVADFHNFINDLSATQSFTWLYYAVDKSIDYLQSIPLPDDLSEVAVVTFTDGLDIGSLDEKDKEESGKYLSNAQYREALHSRLISEKVSNVDISAYSIGVLEGKGSSLTSFRSNMSSLSTSATNVYEVEKMEGLNQVFEQIANSLSETKYVQQFVLSISGHGEGELCRFTFDNVSSYQASELYIEGTYHRKDKALTNIKYVGLTSTSGSEVVGVFDAETGKYDYTFEGLKANDGTLIPTTIVQHWFTDEGTWQDVDDEFFFNPDDATLEKIKRSAAIMLNLDCSKSMDGQKLSTLKEAANKFVQTLADNTVDPSEVSSVKLDKSKLSLQIGETTTLKATVLPSTAKLKTVTWNSSNPSVATVDGNGKITAIALGETNIIVTTKDGGFTAVCEITVVPTPAPQNLKANVDDEGICISWSKAPNTTYTVYHSSNNSDYNVVASNISQGSYIDKNPVTGTNYYKVSATANDIISELSDCVFVKYVPSPTITDIGRVGKEIILTWSTVKDATYNVYRASDTQLKSLIQIASNLNTNSYTDKSPLSKNNYYIVRAVMDGVESQGSVIVSQEYPFINGYEYIDLGLPSGIKWATMNVGASKSGDYGNYYAWGEISTKSTYTAANSVTTNNSSLRTIGGSSKYDAATANWGSTWRLPTVSEYEELINNCTWTWTVIDGHTGYIVKGPNGNSIFLPAAGYKLETSLGSVGSGGYYWSSSCYSDVAAWRLNFNNSVYQKAENYKLAGLSVRPVSD